MLALLLVLSTTIVAGSGGTGGHAYISGFFEGESTVHIDAQLRHGAAHALRVKLSGVNWSARCCDEPGRLATALLISNRAPEMEGFEESFVGQLRKLPAVKLADHTIEIKLTPMPDYLLPAHGGAEMIQVASRIPAEFLESDLDAGVVHSRGKVPEAIIMARTVSIQGLMFSPRRSSPLPVQLYLRRTQHWMRVTTRADSWVADIESESHRPALLASFLGVESDSSGCFPTWTRAMRWKVSRVSDHRLDIKLPFGADYTCTQPHEIAAPSRIRGTLLKSGFDLDRIEGGTVGAIIMPTDSVWDEKSEL